MEYRTIIIIIIIIIIILLSWDFFTPALGDIYLVKSTW